MLPDWLTGSYQRYKADTHAFTNWLSNNAVDTGFEMPDASAGASSHATANKKRKSNEAPAVQVTVRQLLEQAKHLARQQPLVLSSNRGHQHFIDNMKFMLVVLEPNKTLDDGGATDAHKSTSAANRFELLDVEDVDDETMNNMPHANLLKMAGLQIDGKRRVSSTKSDWIFQAFCTFHDFNEIRQYLKELWQQHRDGKIDLVVASTVTETAFHLMECLEELTLRPVIDGKQWDPVDVALRFFRFVSYTRGHLSATADTIGPMWDLSQWLCLWMKPKLEFLAGAMPTKEAFPGYASYDLAADRSRMSVEARYRQDETTLAYIASGMADMAWFRNDYTLLVQDRISRAFHDAARTGPVGSINIQSLWLMFGMQSLIDTHNILQAKVAMPYKRLRVTAKLSKAMRLSYGAFLQSEEISRIGIESWTKDDDNDLRGLTFLVHNVESDELGELQRQYARARKASGKHAPLPVIDAPFAQNPVLCGLNILAIQLDNQQTGIQSADLRWSVVEVAHLYNALRAQGSLTGLWPSMEKLIQVHTPEYIFHGGRPTNLRDCHAKARLGKGLPADMSLPTSSVRGKVLKKTRATRKLGDSIRPLSNSLRLWLLPEVEERQSVTGQDGPQSAGLLVALLEQHIDTPGHKKRVVPGGDEKMPQLALLDFLRSRLTEELPGLSINYFALNEKCIRILLLLRAKFVSAFRVAGFKDHEQELRSLPHIAEDVLLFCLADPEALRRVAAIVQEELSRKKEAATLPAPSSDGRWLATAVRVRDIVARSTGM
ncbi:hypothetical protein LTR36_004116 [Oleoguttula mirabilis]|uniref:DUF6604 domain-containing protein n=1 Tax=Oleoguttula mirabilis TaxID=1507867 RepID=A0AAV9JHH8_9PEZI|nr:hypothetical protein LTR36_004116 [Oleoguttula mirabilis]